MSSCYYCDVTLNFAAPGVGEYGLGGGNRIRVFIVFISHLLLLPVSVALLLAPMYSQARDATNSSDLQDYYDHVPVCSLFLQRSFLDLLQSLQLASRSSSYGVIPSQNIPLTASSSIADLGGPFSDLPARIRAHYGDRRGEFASVSTPYVDEKAPSSSKRKWVCLLPSFTCYFVLTFSLGLPDTCRYSSWCIGRRSRSRPRCCTFTEK